MILSVLLVGCAYDPLNMSSRKNTAPKPDNRTFLSFDGVSGYYRVKPGDTLYSIAFKYGVDYHELAKLNGISSSYVIYPDQQLRLSNSVAPVPSSDAGGASKSQQTVASNSTAQATKSHSSSSATRSSKTVNNSVKTSSKPLKWIWPINGTTLKGFSSKGVSSKGIDIKGSLNDEVLSAADGVVVYAGNGLIGYGNLVIVKHNDKYLSAYAYNQKILVKEQQAVRAGETLAIIGGKGKERSVLHFEVRMDGQPIDPLTVLPKSKNN